MHKKSCGLLTNANQYYDGRFTNGFTWPEFLTMPNTMLSHSGKGKLHSRISRKVAQLVHLILSPHFTLNLPYFQISKNKQDTLSLMTKV